MHTKVMPYNPDHYQALARTALEGAAKAEAEMPGRVETVVIASLASCLSSAVNVAEAARAMLRDEYPASDERRLKPDQLIGFKAAAASALMGVEDFEQAGIGGEPAVQLASRMATCLGMVTDEVIRLYAAASK